jgi:hypothetical protein
MQSRRAPARARAGAAAMHGGRARVASPPPRRTCAAAAEYKMKRPRRAVATRRLYGRACIATAAVMGARPRHGRGWGGAADGGGAAAHVAHARSRSTFASCSGRAAVRARSRAHAWRQRCGIHAAQTAREFAHAHAHGDGLRQKGMGRIKGRGKGDYLEVAEVDARGRDEQQLRRERGSHPSRSVRHSPPDRTPVLI